MSSCRATNAKALLVLFAEERIAAAYERGLRRGMAIAREHVRIRHDLATDSAEPDWTGVVAQMEREIEEARR